MEDASLTFFKHLYKLLNWWKENCQTTMGFTKYYSMDEILVNIPVPVFGGIFPATIYNNEVLEKGTIIAGLLSTPDVQVIPGLSSNVEDFDDLIDEKYHDNVDSETMFVIVDGMATRVLSQKLCR